MKAGTNKEEERRRRKKGEVDGRQTAAVAGAGEQQETLGGGMEDERMNGKCGCGGIKVAFLETCSIQENGDVSDALNI